MSETKKPTHVLVKPPQPGITPKPENYTNSQLPTKNQSLGSTNQTIVPKKLTGILIWGVVLALLLGLSLAGALMYQNLNSKIQTLQNDRQNNEQTLQNLQKQNANLKQNPNPEQALKSVVQIQRQVTHEEVSQIRNGLGPRLDSVDREKLGKAQDPSAYWTLVGTGFAVDKDLVVTNKHVAALKYTYRAVTSDNRIFNLQRVAVHPLEDLAILKLDGEPNLSPINFASTLERGQSVFALGHPLGLTNTISQGLVSSSQRNFLYDADNYFGYIRLPQAIRNASDRSQEEDKLNLTFRFQQLGYADMIQHNASINYGSSGGPIVNTDGQLVAVNTFGIKRQDTRTFNLNPGVDALADINSYNDLQNKVNEGYAPSSDFNQNGGIHVDVVKKFLETYRNSTGVPFLDAYGSSVSPSQAAFWGLPKEYGFWLSGLQDSFYKIDEPGVIKDGDLAAAGLQNNDLITALNGTQLERQGIGTILINLEPGKEVSLEFYHQNEDKTWSQKQTTVKISLIKLWGEADLNGMQIGELKL